MAQLAGTHRRLWPSCVLAGIRFNAVWVSIAASRPVAVAQGSPSYRRSRPRVRSFTEKRLQVTLGAVSTGRTRLHRLSDEQKARFNCAPMTEASKGRKRSRQVV